VDAQAAGDLVNALFLQQLIGAVPREERALIVSGSPVGSAPELVAHLASHVGFVVAVDSGAEVVRAAGVRPDLVLGDFDSIDPQLLASLRAEGVESVAYDAYKDSSDLELALAMLRQRGFTTLIATNVLGGRIDHELAALGNLAASVEQGAKTVLVEETESCVFLTASADRGEGVLGLEFFSAPAPALISLVPWGGEAIVSIQGVEWELDHAVLAPASSRGVSNVLRATHVDIKVHAGTVIVVFGN
jgi:thiamine pyrophosphokinase